MKMWLVQSMVGLVINIVGYLVVIGLVAHGLGVSAGDLVHPVAAMQSQLQSQLQSVLSQFPQP